MADVAGTVVTFTVDRLAYSPSPPVVFAVVDFDGGGRLPVELTDVDADDVAIGDRVEMTFRRLNHRRRHPQLLLEGPSRPWPDASRSRTSATRRSSRMSSHGIKDQVAIVGMGCTPFREHWDKGTDDLLIDAADRGVRVGRRRQGRRRRLLVRHRAVAA